MQKITFATVGASPALTFARHQLTAWGYSVLPQIDQTVTHLLLPVPSFQDDGTIRGGPPLESLLPTLPKNITILGGNLTALPFSTVDFLKDPYYTAENAAITAHCALTLAMQAMPRTLRNAKILLIGWGRIGKCLGEMLRSLGAELTVAVRKASDLALLEAMGYCAAPSDSLNPEPYDLIINTAPTPILDGNRAKAGAILLDLASSPGISGDSVLWARGLPGKMAPESSGILIAKTALRYALRKE